MTANAAPFTVRLWVYPDADPAASADNWGASEDISAYIRQPGSEGGQPISYTYGRQDWASDVDASTMSLTLDNTDGRFSVDNAMGAYYPRLKLGTPIVMGTVSGSDDFARTSSSGWGTSASGHAWTVSGTATDWTVGSGVGSRVISAAGVTGVAQLTDADALDVTGYFTASMSATATGASLVSGARVRVVDNSNFYFLTVEFNTDSTVSTKIWYVHGVFTELAALHPIPSLTYAPGDRFRCRFEASGPALRVKVWAESSSEPAAWQATTTHTTLTGTGVGLAFWRLTGNTNTNPTASFDNPEFVGIEYTGNVVQWPVAWDMSGRNCWAPIQAAGILRRLQKAKRAIQSPLRRQLPSYNPVAYWPLEDGELATSFANVVANQPAATYSAVSPAADGTLDGGGDAPSLTSATGRITGSTGTATGGTGFSFLWFQKLAALPGGKTVVATLLGTGRIVRWIVYTDDTAIYVEGYESDGTKTVDQSNLWPTTMTEWHSFQLETEVVGANTNWALDFNQVGQDLFYGISGSYASTTVSTIRSWKLSGTLLNGCSFAHVWMGQNTLPYVAASFLLVSSGYVSETTAARAARVASEAGIQLAVEPGATDPMGKQRKTTALGVFQSARDAELGDLYERGAGLGFRPRVARYNRAVLMALTQSSGHLADAPAPVTNDQLIRNSWQVSRDDGSYAVAEDADSIAANGEYPDQITINVQTDDVLQGHAEYRRHLGTLPGQRWPDLTLDFVRNPSLLPLWRARTNGFRLTVDLNQSQMIGADPDLIAEGYTATLWPNGWTARLNCSQAVGWGTGVYDNTVKRYDSGSTVTHASYASGATTIVFKTATFGDIWSAAGVPYPCLCSGEQFTVTAMGPDGTFETVGLPGWGSPVNGTFVRSTAQAHTGSASGLLTVTGTPTQTYVRQPGIPVTVGVSYRIIMWAYSVAGVSNILAVIDWLDSGGGYLSSTAQSLTLAAATWTPFDVTGVAPASAAFAQYGPTIGSSPATGTAIYVDDIWFQQASGSTGYLQTATVTRSVNGVAKTLPSGSEIHIANPGRYAL